MRRFILIITVAVMMSAIAVVTASPVLGQNLVAGDAGNPVALSQSKGETEAGFIDLVPVQQCLLDEQGEMFFRVMNQGRGWTAPATTTTVAVSTGGAPFHADFPTAPIPPGGFVDLPLGAGPASLGAHVVGFAITADSTNQVAELDKRNNVVGWSCSDRVGVGATLPSTGGLSSEWLYAMFAAGGVLVSASLTAGVFVLRRRIRA